MEWKKVWKSKKTIGIFIGLLCFQVFFFVYTIQKNEISYKEIWGISKTEKHQQEEIEYVEGFHKNIQEIIEKADSMGEISIFAQTDSYSGRNLEKTKNDFERLFFVEPIVFDNQFLSVFFSDKMQNLLMVVCIILVALVLMEENKQGLRCMIFAAVNGRSYYIWKKIKALAVWTIIIVGAFYGVTFLSACMYYGKTSIAYMAYPIQSLSFFQSFPYAVTIGEFLGIYFLYRCLTVFFIGFCIWIVLFTMNNLLYSVGCIGSFGMLTYLAYKWIEGKHPLNFLHYCNPWYLMSGCDFFTEYYNLKIFQHAINKNTVICIVYILSVLLCMIAALAAGNWKYPCSSSSGRIKRKLSFFGKKLHNTWNGFVAHLSITGVEYYKVLVSQKGMVIIAVLIGVMIPQADFTNIILSTRQELYFAFIENYEGVPSQESEREIENLAKMLAEIEETYQAACEGYEKGEILADEWAEQNMRYAAFEQDRLFLKDIQTQTEYLENLEEERGISGWYINTYAFQKLFQQKSTFTDILLIFGTVLISSGIFANEKKCGIQDVMRGSVWGRSVLFKKKIQVAGVLTFLLFLTTSLLEMGTIAWVYGLSGLSAPVQSVMQLSFIPWNCSIGMFLILLFFAKMIVLLAVTAFTCMCSVKTNQQFTIGGSFLLCIPSCLYMIGFSIFRYVSIIDMLQISPLLLNTQSVDIVMGMVIVLLFAGIISIRICYKDWCITR